MTDKQLTERERLQQDGLLPSPCTDGYAQAPTEPDHRAQAAVFMNDELQRSLQSMAERCAFYQQSMERADRARWYVEGKHTQAIKALEWFTRYLPESALLDSTEDRLAREVIHYVITGEEWTPEGSPVSSVARPDYTGLSMAEAVFQALGAASMAWQPRPSHQVFKSEEAQAVGDALLARLELEMVPPHHDPEPVENPTTPGYPATSRPFGFGGPMPGAPQFNLRDGEDQL